MSDKEKEIFKQDEDAVIAEIEIEQSAFRSFSTLYSDTYIDYCSNPFDPDIKKNVVKEFTYPTIEDPDMTILPPFVNSHKSVAIDQGNQD